YDETDAKNPKTVIAKTGEIVQVKTANDLGSAAVLDLFNGSMHRNNPTDETYEKLDFAENKQFLHAEEGADTTVMKPDYYSSIDLMKRIHETKDNEFHGREWRGELYKRIFTAISPILFVLLGIGFGTVRTRAVRASAAVVAVLTLTV